ncbi:thiamine pyrophosphate-binding protein [Sporosarcina pasteurii]|uniref:Acetolactate synthase isozyme 3 large subunit n=1 Tax=Sporosarcina pasteurii TaxID=1474 RepID=A0A380C2P7_SPOPA|nr:thiamine pyrophosphate-binding protein [Sporosarcina pasteurii]MDS9471636.1 thiamine pyrophosphate-binding protein [Sporosarcina pasteurii]QBQ04757.1 thiamine pyrophosphate-binding protein [Sporosarcina pasteurii]SUJ11541.1 Acetolactate synthase isozyme 3 large subunit [Sporosarcina pasteurii]
MGSTQEQFTVADAIVKELVKAGVETAYGIVSIHNMPIYDAILREGSIDLVCARGESGAVNMADGHARSTGKLGVAITSTGTGAGNAAGSLVEAWSAGVPLLHITGEVSSEQIGTGRGYIHECKNQLQMMEGACKKAFQLKVPEQATGFIRKAIKEAFQAPSGPISVEIPIDYQSAIIPDTLIYDEAAFGQSAQGEFNVPEAVVKTIKEAKRPVLWVGNGAILSGASEQIKRLAEMTGAPVITSQSAKGIIPEDHPQCIGHFGAYPETKQFMANADLLISVGVRFRSNETSGWSVEVPENHITIDADYLAVSRNYDAKYGLVGDIKIVVESLASQIEGSDYMKPSGEYSEEVQQLRETLRATLRETLGPYENILDSMRNRLNEDTIFVRDVTIPANVWGSRLFEIYKPRHSIHASGGGIGQALPTGIGAQKANPDKRIVVLAGDGGFMVNIGELATAVQENLPMIILVFDDSGYGVLRNIQDAAYGRQIGVDLVSPDFVQLAHSMGIESSRVGSTDAFDKALEKATESDEMTMIVIDMEAVGPMAKPFGGPPGVASSFKPKKIK